MARAKEMYVAIRVWNDGYNNGIDILGYSRQYAELAKFIDDMATKCPYCAWELDSGLDKYSLTIEPNDECNDIPLFLDSYGEGIIEASCRYKDDGRSNWTCADFYIAAVEAIK